MTKTIKTKTTEIIAIRDKLVEVLVLVEGGDGLWKYIPGWSDRLVSEFVNPNLGANHTAHVRISEFGPLRWYNREQKKEEKEEDGVKLRLMAHDDVLLKIHARLDHIESKLDTKVVRIRDRRERLASQSATGEDKRND